MKKSGNEKVQKYLEEILMINDKQFNILQKLREIVIKNYPQVNERIMYGGIMFSFENDFGGIFPYKNHISFEFSNGYLLNDPEKILQGNGKFRRHIKIETISDIDTKKIEFFVKETLKK